MEWWCCPYRVVLVLVLVIVLEGTLLTMVWSRFR
jgi:hypothetical protein